MSKLVGFSSPFALSRTLKREYLSCDRSKLSIDSEMFNSTDDVKQSFYKGQMVSPKRWSMISKESFELPSNWKRANTNQFDQRY